MTDTGTVIPIPSPGSGGGRRAQRERREWRLIHWGVTTLSKAGTLLVLTFIYLYFWRVSIPIIGYWQGNTRFPYLGHWQDDVYAAVAALIVVLAFVAMRLPEALSQAPGDEVAVIKKVLFALIPSYLLPVVFYRQVAESGVVAPYGAWWFALLYAVAIIALIIVQIYLGLRYSERTTEVGPTPPG